MVSQIKLIVFCFFFPLSVGHHAQGGWWVWGTNDGWWVWGTMHRVASGCGAPMIKRGIDAFRIYILGLGFRALGRTIGARDQVNLHPESESGVKKHPSYTENF